MFSEEIYFLTRTRTRQMGDKWGDKWGQDKWGQTLYICSYLGADPQWLPYSHSTSPIHVLLSFIQDPIRLIASVFVTPQRDFDLTGDKWKLVFSSLKLVPFGSNASWILLFGPLEPISLTKTQSHEEELFSAASRKPLIASPFILPPSSPFPR